MSQKNRIRLFLPLPLTAGVSVQCAPEQAHYLLNVMRQSVGNVVYVFNGKDGEFEATISQANKKQCTLSINKNVALFSKCPDVTLIFSPLKKDSLDYLIQKSVELGVSCLQPVITEYTNAPKPKKERLEAQIIEACEQSRRQDIPKLNEAQSLEKLLDGWSPEKTLLFFDETGKGQPFAAISNKATAPCALLIGPEGGFSEKELDILRNLPYTQGVSLGKRILRAETAAAATLSCWQAFCGDWR